MRYDYKCLNKKCLKEFEVNVPVETKIKFRRHAGVTCSHCHSRNVIKVISAPAVHFKGKGFYTTDKNE